MHDSNVYDACPNFESAILDYFDGTLNEPERRRVEMHLASCAACQAFWQEQKKVDALLSACLRQPGLPLNFKGQMIERAKAISDLTESANSVVETEVDNMLIDVRKSLLRVAAFGFLDAVGVMTVATVAVMFGHELVTRSALLDSLSSQQVSFYGATAVGFAGLLGGVCFAFKERIRAALESV